jgi:uncharacterized protein
MTPPFSAQYKTNAYYHGQGYYHELLSPEGADTAPLLVHINEFCAKHQTTTPTLPGFLPQIAKRNILFIDIETSGTARYHSVVSAVSARLNGHVTMQGYAALHPLQEKGILGALARECAESEYIITHGGTSFDLPFLEKRYAAHGLGKIAHHRTSQRSLKDRHLDLLSYARKVLRTPDQKLSTLEELHLGYTRTNDLPGREVPAAYQQYLYEGDTEALAKIMRHNTRDTLATLALFCYLALGKK